MAKNKFLGSWHEPLSLAIELPFSRESLEQVLLWGARPEESKFSHRDIAHWCERFWAKYMDVDPPKDIERLLPILADVECQWDLFLANSYALAELQKMDFDKVRLPHEWFVEWLKKVRA